MANQEATSLASRCFKRAREKGASRSAAVRIAAAVLTKAAIDRGSKDNVTVVIVDVSNVGRSGEAPTSATVTLKGSEAAATATTTAGEEDESGAAKPVPASEQRREAEEQPAAPAPVAAACEQVSCA